MRVGLFVTCLVDAMRPSVGFAALKLLEGAGCEVVVPAAQTCCGQPAWNSGDTGIARSLALKLIGEFEGLDYVVVPSGSCGGMIRVHFPRMFRDDPDSLRRAEALAARTFELTDFLVSVLAVQRVPGVALHEMAASEACCGFGGLFAVKFGEVSAQIAERKCRDIVATGADAVVLGDVGCMLNIEGRLRRLGNERTRVLHVAEVLAGEA